MRGHGLRPLIGQYFQMRESRATTPLVEDYERPWSLASDWSIFLDAWVTSHDPVGRGLWEAMVVSLQLQLLRNNQLLQAIHPRTSQVWKHHLWCFDFYTFRIFEWSMLSVLFFGRLFAVLRFFNRSFKWMSPPLLDLVLSVMGGEEACLLLPTHQPTQGHSQAGPHCNENPIYVFLFCELRGLSLNFLIHMSVSDL